MSENKKILGSNSKVSQKEKKNTCTMAAVKMETREVLEKQNSDSNFDFANLKIGEPTDLNPSSSFLKRSHRLEGRQESEKKSKDNDFLSHSKSPMTTSDQFSMKKGVSVDPKVTPVSAKHKETCSNELHKGQKNAECGTHSHEKMKQSKMKNASPRRGGKKHIRKLDFSLPMEILNKHAFLLWFSERYQEYSRQYPNDSVLELQDRRRSYWDQLDYRKKAPYYQRARDASCVQYIHPVESATQKTANTAVEKVESRPKGKLKNEPPTQSARKASVQKHFNFKQAFDQMVNDLIWGRPVHFERTSNSEKLTQILKDLADLETSGKLMCVIK